ncbi:hypothetical protein ACJDT4_00150 [Clostridium neuense]|uniref:Uncharacterized protein n=1 Tax=Clostridium neuense TaxID=1728934 RepID=A0ABW8T8R4_9CLOT
MLIILYAVFSPSGNFKASKLIAIQKNPSMIEEQRLDSITAASSVDIK